MKYMLLIYDNDTVRETFAGDPALMQEIEALMSEITASGELVDTGALADPSQTKLVAAVDGTVTATDGPYAEAKEHLGGYLMVDVATPERATEIAMRWPSSRFSPLEVRPLMDAGGAEL